MLIYKDMTLNPLRYPHESLPQLGDWIEIADGIFWLSFPLPFALNHVHVWILKDGPGWFVIDSGIGGEQMHSLWQKIIADKLGGRPITRLLLTHFHPDHMGSAGFLHQQLQPELLMNATEWQHARRMALEPPNYTKLKSHYHTMGMPADLTDRLTDGSKRYSKSVDIPPETFTPLKQGDLLTINGDIWKIITGGGHSPEQVTLYCAAREIYISADQILPKISPNVSTWASDPTHDALGDYLNSMPLLDSISDNSLVLPSHNRPFYGLKERIEQLKAHHTERLEQIVDLVTASPLTVYDITRHSFDRPLDDKQMSFAVGEILAHCNHLIDSRTINKEIDTGGIWQLRRAG